ncbi:MAG: hypothetical protein ABIS92_10355 [Polyangia bacterium]
MSLVILVAIAVGAGLLGSAMWFYPGGTALDPRASGHSFWFNFMCDLTNRTAVNGQPNHPGASLARAGLMCLCLALGVFWVILPLSFGPRCSRRMARAITTPGLVSVVGLLLVPVAQGWFHVTAVFASSVPALAAGMLALVGTVRYARRPLLVVIASATVATAAIDSVLYGLSYQVQPRVVIPALPLFQRLALVLMLTWMSLVAARTWRQPRHDRTHS